MNRRGTKVLFRLRSEFVNDPPSWFHQLREYLVFVLHYLLCQFQLSSSIPQCDSLILEPGWALSQSDFAINLLSQMGETPEWRERGRAPIALRSAEQKQKLEQEHRYWDNMRTEARQHCQWIVDEGELPDGLGHYRVSIPYFSLECGASLGVLRVTVSSGQFTIHQIGNGQVWIPMGLFYIGWKGMRLGKPERWVRTPLYSFELVRSAVIELDWTSANAGPPRAGPHALCPGPRRLRGSPPVDHRRHRAAPPEAEKPRKTGLFYSRRKKKHCDKNVVVVNTRGKRIDYLGRTCPGKTHDNKIADAEGISYPPGATLYKDTGFQGYEPAVKKTCQAKKKATPRRTHGG
jgi:hypothetical protein